MAKKKTKAAPAAEAPDTLDAAGKPDTQMKAEMRSIHLENEMMEKALQQRKKLLKQLREAKAEEELLIGGQQAPRPAGDGAFLGPDGNDGDGEGEELPPRRSPDFRIAANAEFEQTLAEFTSTDGKVEIYRLKNGNYAKVGTYPAKEWGATLDKVAVQFGGGDYKVKLRSPDGTFAGETIVSFDEEAYPRPKAEAAGPSVDVVGLIQNYNEKLQAVQKESTDRMLTLMQTILASKSNTPPAPPPVNPMDMLRDIVNLKKLFEPEKKDAVSDVEKLLGVFEKGMAFGASSTPPEDDSLMGIVKALAMGGGKPPIMELLKGGLLPPPPAGHRPAASPQTRPNPSQILPPAPAGEMPVDPAEIPAQEPVEMNPVTKMIISTYKPILLGYAKAAEAPRKVAEMIVTRIATINEGWLLIVDDFLKVPTTKEEWVYGNAPELREYDEWVTGVMTEMSAIITAGFAEEAPAEAPSASPAPAPAPAPKPAKNKKTPKGEESNTPQ